MKTTIDIDDALLVSAKKRAAELHCPLRKLIQDGLRDQLTRRQTTLRSAGVSRLKWVTVDGGVPEDAHIESREAMHEWLKS